MSADDIWRIVNAVLAFGAAIMVLRNLFSKWSVRRPRMRLMSLALLALLLASGEGSLESMIAGYPPGPRTVLTTAACIWVVIAVVMTPDDYSEIERDTVEHDAA